MTVIFDRVYEVVMDWTGFLVHLDVKEHLVLKE